MLAIFLMIFSVSAARADNMNSNRQIFPLGESESFLGNAGVARAHDTGAVYYNPAGLSELTAGRVSMSGSLYLSFHTETDAIAILDKTNIPYQASGFNTIPAFYVAAFRFDESWTGAFSVLVPNSLQLENHVSFTTPNTSGDILQSLRESDLWLGFSLAHKIDSQWSIGVSLFGIQHSEAQGASFEYTAPASTTGAFVTSETQQALSVTGISAVFGVDFHASDAFEIGLRAQTPLARVLGTADTYQSIHSVSDLTNGTVTASGENKLGTRAAYELPFDFTLGTAFTPTDWFTLLADVSLQLGTHYDSIPESVLSDAVDFKPTARVNLGFEFRPGSGLMLRTGFYYIPSANGGDETASGFTAENYMGVTGGVCWRSSRVETGLGAFYIWSSGHNIPALSTDGSSSPGHSYGTGGLLTASYLL